MDGRFEIRDLLGAGGMGRVHRAYDRERGEVVALKSLRRAETSDIERFKREFRSLTDLGHPSLVTLHELFCTDQGWFFTMELVDGADFVDHVRGQARDARVTGSTRDVVAPTLPVARWNEQLASVSPPPSMCRDAERLRRALRQLIEGLLVLHETGRLHGDVKPSNVMVTPDERVVLLDFGLVAELEPHGAARRTGLLVGTPPYMAPEQLAGEPSTTASDWYSVGAMLFEALTGRLPFVGTTTKVMLEKQLRDPPRIAEVLPEVPDDLALLCDGFLARDPARRMSGREALSLLGGDVTGEVTSRIETASVFPCRDDALHVLRDAYLDTRRGEAVAVVVHGDSGVGKTALVRHFLAGLPADAIVLQGRCYECESVPFKGLDEIVERLAATLQAMPDGASYVPDDVLPLVRVFPALARVVEPTGDGRARDAAVDGDLRARAFAAFRQLLARLAATCAVVLAIDDAQWGDGDGAALLAELIATPGAPPVLVIATCRVADRASAPLVRALAEARQLPLAALAPDDARTLARLLLDEHAADDVLVERVAHASGGHPLLLLELARHLRTASGAPGVDLEAMVYARFARLSSDARTMLALVAVAGRPIRERIVRDAGEIADGAATAALAALRAARLVRVRRDGVECHHDRVRAAVLATLDPAARRALHRRLARVLEALPDTAPESLVEHLHAAGDGALAAHHAVRAAQRAARALAFERAAGYYALAVEHGVTSAAVWEHLGDARMVLGQHAAAGDAFTRAHAAPAPRRDRARRLRKLATVAQKTGRYGDALALCGEALALVEESHDLDAVAALALAALTCWYAGDLSDGMAWAERAASRLQASREYGAARARVEAALHRARGNLLLGLGRPREAAAEYRRGIAPCDALDDRWERSIAHFNIGEALLEAGDLDGARRYLETARSEKAAIGDRWGLGYTWAVLARAHAAAGDRGRALACAHTAGQFTAEVGDPKLERMLAQTLAQYAPPTQKRIV